MLTALLPRSRFALWALLALFTAFGTAQATSYNVLFITVDDFRSELPAYGETHIQAPNMDRLSNEGLTFNRAYVQQAVCQPARANVLTGARPDTTRIYGVFPGGWPTFRTTMGSVATLPSVFKDNGYWTAGYGKNFHHVDNPSWTESATFYTTQDLYQDPVNRAIAGDVNQRPPWEEYNGNEEDYMDAKVAAAAVQAIRDRAVDGQPFFIAAGFWKPHLPFAVPQPYWDIYDRNTLPIATGPDALPVQGALPAQFYDPFSGELTTYKGGRPPFVGQTAATQQALADGTFTTNQQTGADYGIITVNGTHIYPEDYARAMTHGYYASTSFIDAQIGKLLAALEDPNNDGNTADSLLANTIVVLWGDHGMHIGQHGSWPKHTNMDIATRIPFILHHPDMPVGSQGVLTDALVESVDIMPTVLDLAGLPMPATHPMEGVSLAPLMDVPHQTWKTAAFSQYPREVGGVHYMGYAMRTATHTYMQWREMDSSDGNPISLANRNFTISNRVAYEELYDMVNDPTQTQNIGGNPQYRALMDALGVMVNTALTTNYANTQNVGSLSPAAPEAHAVAFTGGTDVGDTLAAHYIFSDANGDLEASSLVEWVRSEDFNGNYDTVVGTGNTYTLQSADAGKFVKLRVTPIANTAPTTGTAVLSTSAVVAGVGFNDGSDLPAPQSSVYEGFDYPAGVLSSTSAGGRGWNGGWWGNDGLSFGGNSGSQAVDFTWSNLPAGYHHAPAGRAGSNGANSNNPYRQLSAEQTIDLGQNGTRYFSFLYRYNNSAPTFEKRFHAGTTEVLKLQINASGSLSLISPDETNMDLLSLDANTDYVVLGRLQSVAAGNDTLSVAIYKSGQVVPDQPPVFTASVNVASSAVIDRIFMGNPFNGSNVGNSFWDELHIDSNYSAVVGSAAGDGGEPVVLPTVVESFNYDAGGLSAANNSGIGWADGWFGNDILSFSGNSGAAAAAKSWSLPGGYGFTPDGLAATNSSNGNTPFRPLASGSQIDTAADTVYFSFLFSHASTSMFEYRFHAGTAEVAKLQVDTAGQLRLVGADFLPTGFNLTAGNDYLIVGRIVGNASGDDFIQVNVYPASGNVPETEPVFTHSAPFQSSAVIDRIMVGIPGSTVTSATYWDELRMGPTWGSVVGTGIGDGGDPDPEPEPVVDPVVVEAFDYSAGGLSSASTGGIGWADGWFGNLDLNWGGNSGAAAAAKSWSLPGGYGFTPAGLAATNGSNGNTPFRGLAPAGQIDTAADTVYFSFLFTHASTSMFEYRFYAGTTEITKLQIDTAGQLRLVGTDFLPTGFNLTAGNDYLVVGRIVGNASGDDFIQVSAFPASGTLPESEPIFAHSTPFQSSAVIDRIMMGIPGSTVTSATYWDELRMGPTWGSVLGTAISDGGGDPDPTGTAPEASRVGISGGRNAGDSLQGHYLYADAESDPESGSTFRWLLADTIDGTYAAITGATAQTYTLQPADLNKFIRFEVTPANAAAVEPVGTAVVSNPILIANDITHGLQSHLEFEDADLSSGFADSSGNNKGATTASGTLIARGSGQALLLNGTSDRFTLPFDGTIFDQGLSVAFWAKGDDALMPKNNALAWAIKTTGGNKDNLLLAPGWNNGNLMEIRMGHDGSGFEGSSYAASLADIKGDWTHWAFVKNVPAGTIEVYKNGVLVDTVTGQHTPVYVEDHWATGAGWVVGQLWSVYYAGAIDDYRIYDRQITGAEVAEIHSLFSNTPTAYNVSVSGTTAVGDTLTASYSFSYSEGLEGASIYQWYRADSEEGSYAAISGATALTYTVDAADDGKWLRFGVTPVAQDTATGAEALSAAVATGNHGEPPSPTADLILHLTFDEGTLTDSSASNLTVTGSPGFATADGRSYATLNGVDQHLTVPMIRSFPEGLSIAFWTYAQDGVNGMPKNSALGWARQGGTTGSMGDGVLLSFGWDNDSNALVRVGRENNVQDGISLPQLENWLNNWVHWTVVKDPTAGTISVYRDGELYSSVSNRHIIPAFESQAWMTGAGYRIGSYYDGVYYKGYLDDYRIYDGVLDATAVQTIFQEGNATGPTAFNVTITGTAQAGQLLTGDYDFVYPGGTEGTSTFQWYRSATELGVYTAIDGATSLTYTTTAEDDGRFLSLGVTPVGHDASVGAEALSDPFLIGTFVDRSLANTLYRLTQDQTLNVVFFGGSITDGVGQNNGLSWRTRTENWLSSNFPSATFNFTSAAISGTSSEFGVFRTDRHVLAAQPDLVFVEFAVNDLEQSSNERTRQTMEGIVRKIRAAQPNCDIVFVYTTTIANALNFYENDQLPGRTVIHQEVADHYGIYSIDVAEALVAHKQITGYPYRIEYGQPGAFDPAANHYLPDYVHPSNLGHEVYGDAVTAALNTLLAINPPAALDPHPMPELLSGYDMTSARIIDHTHPDVSYGAGWAAQDMGISGDGRTESFLSTASASTASDIQVAFSGTELGVYYRRSTSGGQIAWNVDTGAASDTFAFWHESLSSFTSFAMLDTALGQGNHQLTVSPQAYTGHETLNIAGWLVMGEFATQEERPVRIMALGDSITYGLYYNSGMPGNQSFPNGYRGRLQDLLQADTLYTNNFEFIGTLTDSAAGASFDPAYAPYQAARYDGSHQGHSGFTTARNYDGTPGSTGNLNDVLLSNYTSVTFNPDIVLLHVGVNDVGQGSLTLANIEQLADDHRTLLGTIFSMQPNAEVYISTIMWNNPNNPNYSKLLAFNNLLATREIPYWQTQGKTVRLVDIFAALEADGYNRETNPHYDSAGGGDALHPNDTGYAAMAQAWFSALEQPAAVATPTTTFERFASASFSHLAGGASHPDAAPTADPDGDGVSNLLEYALGGDPFAPNSAPLPTHSWHEPSGQQFLQLRFTPATLDGLRFYVHSSNDLSQWSSTEVTNSLVSEQEFIHTDSQAVDPELAPRRFLRMQVVEE